MSTLPDAVKLLPSFDVERLLADLGAVEKHFMNHANPEAAYSEEGDIGGWDVLPLRCPGGDPDTVGEGIGGKEDFADTPYLELTPYVREILDGLGVPVRGVRFSTLAAGGVVHEHTDRPYGLRVGWLRLHVPIITNEKAILFINGRPNYWKPGEFWYADFGSPHALSNEGGQARVHLIIDCYISEKAFELFPEEARRSIDRNEVMFFDEEQPLPEDLASLRGTVQLPPSFLDRYPDDPTRSDWQAEGQDDIEAGLDVQDGRLILRVGNRETALAHIGNDEFRPLCWTRERTLTFQSRGRRILFRCQRGSDVLDTAREQPSLESAMPPAP